MAGRVSVFGLGYVGSVTAACLASLGHEVVGVDVKEEKLESMRSGRSPMAEVGLDDLLVSAVASGRLSLTSDAESAIAKSDLSLICVGTPSNRNGSLDLRAVERVAEQIGAAMGHKADRHTVVMRSTVLPGVARNVVVPRLESCSGLEVGTDFGYVSNPEFLREGSAVADFMSPEYTIVGEWDSDSGNVVEELYSMLEAPVLKVSVETAEMVKYASNAFHAVKVAFANEIGHLAKAQGIDGRSVMEILCKDHKLNISPAYLKPGFAFGGSCLPKDTRALVYRARETDVDVPLLAAILQSNDVQVQRAIAAVEDAEGKHIGILGLAFKAGTDDVRESPMVAVIETLVGRGYEVRVFDEDVRLSTLIGANKAYLEAEIPHIASLMVDDLDEVVRTSDVLVVGNSSKIFADLGSRMDENQVLVDLVGVIDTSRAPRGTYIGSGW